jgi:hypothetical protein
VSINISQERIYVVNLPNYHFSDGTKKKTSAVQQDLQQKLSSKEVDEQSDRP